MAEEESAAPMEQQPPTTELSKEPLKIHIPRHMNAYTTNLKYLANLYQEKLIEVLKGKLSQTDLDKINEIVAKIIADSL